MGSGIFLACLFTLLPFVALTTAQCSEGYGLDVNPFDCIANSDPSSPDYLEIAIYQPAGVCEDNVYINAEVSFTGLDGHVTSAQAINPGTNLQTPTYYLDFNVPLSLIPNGATVTEIFALTDLAPGNLYGSETYTAFYVQTHIQTLVTATSTVTIPTYVITTSTTTNIAVASTTATIIPPTVTDTVATGTETISTAVTTTSTITITQKPVTYTTHPVVYTTITIPCVGSSHRRKIRSNVQALENRQGGGVAGAEYSPPFCGTPTNTTVSTATILTTSTSTIVIPDTVLSTTTTTATTTLATPTTYLFVEDSTTVTQTQTVKTWTVIGGGVLTVTKDITVTATVYASTDKHGRPAVCTSSKPALGGAGAALGKPTKKGKPH